MKSLTRTARLTLFSTAVITAVMFVLQLFLLDNMFEIPQLAAIFALPVTAGAAYVISAVVIDRAMNPIRLMIERIREMGKLNFTKPLVVHGEGEDVREYADAFNHMARQVNDYIERQKRFISDASHELATPLTVINGHADMLLRRVATENESADIPNRLTPENAALLQNSLAVIKNEALRMGDLVDSLLMLARSDAEKERYAFAAVDMSALVEAAVAEARLIAPDVSFEADVASAADPPANITAVADENALRRVMRILLSNAIRHAAPHADAPRVTLALHASRGLAHIVVRDNGPGIVAADLPHIFERFYRADAARQHAAQSSGLGLSIAREIIAAHGGEIQARSTPGEGAEFTFFIKSS